MLRFLCIIGTIHSELTLVLIYVSWVLRVYIFRWSRECSKDDVDSQHGARQLHGHCCRRANPGSSHWSVSADLPWHPVPGPDGKHLCGPEMPKLVLIALIPFFLFLGCFLLGHSVYAVFLPFKDILQGNFKPDYYLKHIQKDLRLAISMGDMANHPTPMAAAANEVKYCIFQVCGSRLVLIEILMKPIPSYSCAGVQEG